jgi:predicted ester cyclase/uncharacterized damage-inducible protein DinB
MDRANVNDFATRYAKAWCSQVPERVAAFYAEDGSLSVNESPPAVGRQAIADVARGFMIAFPDMEVTMDDVVHDFHRTTFHWTLTGTNSGLGGTGNAVRISGHELWQFDGTGLIRHSKGHFDTAEYDRQLQHGVDGLSALVRQSVAAHYERVRGKIHALVEPLSTEQLWRRPYPYGNSIGHLLLHLTGNLNYYIGTQIAGTHYVRDRLREFADSSCRPTQAVMQDFDRAVELVLATLATQREPDWGKPYQAVGAEDVTERLGMFVRCAAHADHHAGQMIYLCKELGAGS